LLVFNLLDSTAEETLDFWMNSLKARVRQCPIVIVGTHLDDKALNAADVDQRLAAIKSRFTVKFSRAFPVIECLAVSCSPSKPMNIAELRSAIETIISAQKHIGVQVPHSYLLMEDYLKEQAKVKEMLPLLTENELLAIGHTVGLKTKQEVISCTRLLHQAGAIVYFDDDAMLKDFVVLNPQWLTNMMSTLFTTKHRWVKNGILTYSSLGQIWRSFPTDIHATLLHLLAA